MAVRAKMRCEKKDAAGGFDGGGTVRFAPVTAGSPENDRFYKWTPGGLLVLSTINQRAFDEFEEGEEYYVDVSACAAERLQKEPEVIDSDRLLQWFAWDHLPRDLQPVSMKFYELARAVCILVPHGIERTVALRKLLEAKDAAVRARLRPGE